MTKNKPVRLYKKEEIQLNYNKTTVFITGFIIIAALFLIAFGQVDNYNFLMTGI